MKRARAPQYRRTERTVATPFRSFGNEYRLACKGKQPHEYQRESQTIWLGKKADRQMLLITDKCKNCDHSTAVDLIEAQ